MTRVTIGTMRLRDAPTTPLRIVVGIVLAAAWVIVHLVLIVVDAAVNTTVSMMTGTFILIQESIDVSQWLGKRATDIEYVRAKSGAPGTYVTSEHATVTAERAVVANGIPTTGELRASMPPGTIALQFDKRGERGDE
jgi:hypothetical protein